MRGGVSVSQPRSGSFFAVRGSWARSVPQGGEMVKRSVWVGLLILALAVAFGVPQAVAQAVFGSVFGTVTDPQGAGVVGAKVTVTNIAKGSVEETTTNDSGNYTVTHLIPDVYNVRIEAAGFKVFEVKNIQVSADASARTDAALTVGDVTQTVEVSGEVEQLKTDRADVSIEFNSKYVEDLPILNRNFTNFELLSPVRKRSSDGATPRPRILRARSRSSLTASTSAALRSSSMAPTTKIPFWESSSSTRTSTPSRKPRSPYRTTTPSSARPPPALLPSRPSPAPTNFTAAASITIAATGSRRAILSRRPRRSSAALQL